MTIEENIAELTKAMTGVAAALAINNAHLERVVAGQEAAIARHDASAPATRKPGRPKNETTTTEAPAATTTTEAPAATTTVTAAAVEPTVSALTIHPLLAAPNTETAKNSKGEDEPTGNFRAGSFAHNDVKSEFIGWLASDADAAKQKAASDFVAAIGQHFGVKRPFHPTEGIQTDDQRKQALFFLRRKRAGLPVDFGADYDFDVDPLDQGGPAAATNDASALDALG